jgi:hypothetical protein
MFIIAQSRIKRKRFTDVAPKIKKLKNLRSSSAGRVGGDPPKISVLGFCAKMDSSERVKSLHEIIQNTRFVEAGI